MKVVIQQVDLDACLTALLLGVSPMDRIVSVGAKATPNDLADPSVLCIECGGSGQTDLNNFDHHDTSTDLPPASRQAVAITGGDLSLQWLVAYVGLNDTVGPEALKRISGLKEGAFPTLSGVFSGMRLLTEDPKDQLIKGMDIFRLVLERRIDPFGMMPELAEWQGYIEAKRRNDEGLKRAEGEALLFTTEGGLPAGYLQVDSVGAFGILYRSGCRVGIVHNPRFGRPPVKKYTIGGDGIKVDSLPLFLNARDPGWGGPAHGTIIGSPRGGSYLRPEEVIELVKKHL